ncbi:MAG TPA: hypothetical protein VHW44_02480 [Pseudonocardiaceae bacterium]|jgi:hypothetical protein|nr:hypothetical protein [Pseudonocardiaceae bacterium]
MSESGPQVQRFTRQPSAIMFRRVADELPAIQTGWAEFEELVGLRGHKFYGVVDQRTNEYLLCSNIRDDDPAGRFGLEVGELAGGDYLRIVLTGDAPAVYQQVGPTCQLLHTLATADESRHDVEFYRRSDEIEIWMPVS